MSQFEECCAKYCELNKKHNFGLDDALITCVAKGLGPSIYNADSEYVATSDPDELKTVKENFAIGKLGASEEEADAAISAVAEKMSDISHKP